MLNNVSLFLFWKGPGGCNWQKKLFFGPRKRNDNRSHSKNGHGGKWEMDELFNINLGQKSMKSITCEDPSV